jgi:hypothetical protein
VPQAPSISLEQSRIIVPFHRLRTSPPIQNDEVPCEGALKKLRGGVSGERERRRLSMVRYRERLTAGRIMVSIEVDAAIVDMLARLIQV